MAQVQCPNCSSYKVVGHEFVFINDKTGKTKAAYPVSLTLLLLALIVLTACPGLFILVVSPIPVGYYLLIAAGFFGFLFFKYSRRGTPAGYTKYEVLDCTLCGKQWHREAID